MWRKLFFIAGAASIAWACGEITPSNDAACANGEPILSALRIEADPAANGVGIDGGYLVPLQVIATPASNACPGPIVGPLRASLTASSGQFQGGQAAGGGEGGGGGSSSSSAATNLGLFPVRAPSSDGSIAPGATNEYVGYSSFQFGTLRTVRIEVQVGDMTSCAVATAPDPSAPAGTPAVFSPCDDAGPPPPVPGTTSPTRTIPISIDRVNGGFLRASTQVSVGGSRPVRVLLDTGSAGLRVLKESLGGISIPKDLDGPDANVDMKYHGGDVFYGYAASSLVLLGTDGGANGTVLGDVEVMIVEQACHDTALADGGVSETCPDGGTVFGGYDGVLGIAMTGSANDHGIRNPLGFLSDLPDYQVSLNGDAGTLILAPPTASYAKITGTYPMPRSSATTFDDRQVPACLIDRNTNVSYCEGARLDTGNPSTYVETDAGIPPGGDLANGDEVTILIGDSTAPRVDYSVVAGPANTAAEIRIESTTGLEFMNLGIDFFLRNDVFFQQKAGNIAVAPHQ